MGRLAIRQVEYCGDNYFYKSKYLDDGLNIIEGVNGTGKTTFMNLVYYGLGGRVPEFTEEAEKHTEVFNDKNNFVQLKIEINEEKFDLIRFIKKNDISVQDKDGDVEVYPVFRQGEKATFSDWLLQRLDIEVIEIYQGTENWKINFLDLLRLMYHDQAPDPKKIYKTPNYDNFYSDSVILRKAIFEILFGKTYKDYYLSFNRFKQLEKRKNVLSETLKTFVDVVNEIGANNNYEDLNVNFLIAKRTEKETQLDKLHDYRNSLKYDKRPNKSNIDVDRIKNQVTQNKIRLSELESTEFEFLNELANFKKLKDETVLEVTQLKKIIFAHDKLNIFYNDTCPYCLNKVNRKENTCICGNEINEDDYQMFFYSSDEYLDMLKSKQKSVETINLAIESCRKDLEAVSKEKNELKREEDVLKYKLTELVKDADTNFNYNNLYEIDDEIIKLREEIVDIEQQLELESKRDELQTNYNNVKLDFEEVKLETNRLFAEARIDINEKIKLFNSFYNDLMKDTVADCREASIDDSYMPLINGGEYKEASATVPLRLMYFLTLLHISLIDREVAYPRYLMIDTPETAGIDNDNLIKAISKIKDALPKELQYEFEEETEFDEEEIEDENEWDEEEIEWDEEEIHEEIEAIKTKGYQIILSTGINKFPPEFGKFVFESLSKESRLLKSKIEE